MSEAEEAAGAAPDVGLPPPLPPLPVVDPVRERQEAEVARLRGMLERRAAAEPAMFLEVRAFIDQGVWGYEAGAAVGRVGPRWARMTDAQLELGHDDWTGSKRIPL